MKKIQAIFIGQDGSEGFKKGSKYRLTISQNLNGTGFIYISHNDTLVPYDTVVAFLNNWDNIINIKI